MTTPNHMTSDEFRKRGREVVDLIADYYERTVHESGVLPTVEPGGVFASIPDAPPDTPEQWGDILADVQRIVMPGLTHWASPNFFAFFPANSSFPAILGDLLSTGLAQQGMIWQASPACTEVETRMLDWLAQLLGLPERFISTAGKGGGVIHGTASEAVLVALVAGRDRARRATGEDIPNSKLIAYCSDQAHSSVAKAARIAGLPEGNVRLIESDQAWQMRADVLREQIERDGADGLVPFFVCATLGTTSTGAIDPLTEIAQALSVTGSPIWLHIDAAWAGAALVCPEHRAMIEGVERADSFNFNPHKWLLTNFDCSAFWVADRAALIDALSITPAYLRNSATDTGTVIDYRDWQIPLGRRFRALKLWFVMRHYGAQGLQAHVRQHIDWASELEAWIDAEPALGLISRSLALVCFRAAQGDDATRALHGRINDSGKTYMTLTTVPVNGVPAPVIRWAIGATLTTRDDVERTWHLVKQLMPA
jgi:aromatic-L-amino-acid decarboxylase